MNTQEPKHQMYAHTAMNCSLFLNQQTPLNEKGDTAA